MLWHGDYPRLEARQKEQKYRPSHSQPRHYLEVSGKLHVPAALAPVEKFATIEQESGWAPGTD
jgi:hypothetical protein